MVSSSAQRAEEWHVGARAMTQWLLLERICNQTHPRLSASHFRNKIFHTLIFCEYQFLYSLEKKNIQKPPFSFEDFGLNPLGKAGLLPSWSARASRVGGGPEFTPGAPSPTTPLNRNQERLVPPCQQTCKSKPSTGPD